LSLKTEFKSKENDYSQMIKK